MRYPYEAADAQSAIISPGAEPLDLPLSPPAPSSVAVWRGTGRLPFGTTISYAQLAHAWPMPAMRAVGAGWPHLAARLPVIGYRRDGAGRLRGRPVKEFLLRLEGALPAEQGGLF